MEDAINELLMCALKTACAFDIVYWNDGRVGQVGSDPFGGIVFVPIVVGRNTGLEGFS